MIMFYYSAFPLQRHELLLIPLYFLFLLHLLYFIAYFVLLRGDLRLIPEAPLIPLVAGVIKGLLFVRLIVHQALH